MAVHGLEVSRLDLGPERTGNLAVAAQGLLPRAKGAVGVVMAAAAGLATPRENVVLAVLDGLGAEHAVKLVAAGVLIGPDAHGLEHVLLDLDAVVARGRVVEGAQDIVDDLVDGYAGVFPGIQDSAVDKSAKEVQKSMNRGSYGTAYCRIVDATLPAQGFRMFVKWSFESIECVGSVQWEFFHGSSCELELALMTPEEPSFRTLET